MLVLKIALIDRAGREEIDVVLAHDEPEPERLFKASSSNIFPRAVNQDNADLFMALNWRQWM